MKGRRQRHVNSKSDQHQGHQLATKAGDARGIANAAAAFPDDRAQHATAIERITRKKIEYGQQKISSANKKTDRHHGIRTSHRSQLSADKTDQGKKKTCRRARDGDAKLGARTIGLRPQARETAKRMQHNLFDLDPFRNRH